MLERAALYFAWWHVPVAVALLGAWVFLGAYLLRRAVGDRVRRTQARLGRCVLVCSLCGLAGAIAAAVLFLLLDAIGSRLDEEAKWYGIPAGAAGFLLITYVVLYASFSLPARAALGVWARGLGLPVLLLAASTPAWVYSYRRGQHIVAQRHGLVDLRTIGLTIRAYHLATGRLPQGLPELAAGGHLPSGLLHAFRSSARECDYFYRPARLLDPHTPTQAVLACDYADNHDGRGRVVLFANGETKWYPAHELPALFELPANRGFAAALRQAESALARPAAGDR